MKIGKRILRQVKNSDRLKIEISYKHLLREKELFRPKQLDTCGLSK